MRIENGCFGANAPSFAVRSSSRAVACRLARRRNRIRAHDDCVAQLRRARRASFEVGSDRRLHTPNLFADGVTRSGQPADSMLLAHLALLAPVLGAPVVRLEFGADAPLYLQARLAELLSTDAPSTLYLETHRLRPAWHRSSSRSALERGPQHLVFVYSSCRCEERVPCA